jgi:hypothetical protein
MHAAFGTHSDMFNHCFQNPQIPISFSQEPQAHESLGRGKKSGGLQRQSSR